MNNGFSWKRAVLALLVAVVLAAGCSKKQTVKTEGGPAPGDSAAAAPAGEVKETPITEGTVPPGARAPGEKPAVVAKSAEAGVAVTEEKPSQFSDVLFDFDKADLTDEGKKICQAVAESVRRSPKAKLQIEGHCDERGTAEYNLALGERRATAVRNYLVSLGVPKEALGTVSFGKERPVDPGHTEAAWAKNRRAHFVLK